MKKLTKRDLDIMEILWKHEEPIAASEIQKEIPELSKNSADRGKRDSKRNSGIIEKFYPAYLKKITG